MPDVLADARQLIQSRLTDLDQERERLERAVASLGEGSAPKRWRGRPRQPTTATTSAPPKAKHRAPRKRKADRS